MNKVTKTEEMNEISEKKSQVEEITPKEIWFRSLNTLNWLYKAQMTSFVQTGELGYYKQAQNTRKSIENLK